MEKYYEVRLSSWSVAVCMIIFGILLLIFPEMSGTIFTRGFASVVLLLALSHVWKFFRARKHEMNGTGNLIGAVLLLILSGIGFFKPEIILSFLPFVTGALLLLDGIIKFPLIKEMWDWGSELRWSAIVSVILPFFLGVFLMAYPFQAATVVIRVFGGFMLIDGASDIARNIVTKRKANV